MNLKKLSFDFELKEISDEGVFTGYGSTFNDVDFGGDVVVPGAFKRTLAEKAVKERNIPILWQHDTANPLGHYSEVLEDKQGLWVKGVLELEVAKAREAKSLMKNRVITGLSIGYGVKKASFDEKTGVRTLLDLDLHEISLVTFPMNDNARIEAVKRRIERGAMPKTIKDFEKFLRDAGFSKSNAAYIANNGIAKLLRSESGSKQQAEAKQVLDLLNNFQLPTI